MLKPDFPYYGDAVDCFLNMVKLDENMDYCEDTSNSPKYVDIGFFQDLTAYGDSQPFQYAHAQFIIHEDRLVARTVWTREYYRRWGIMTMLYDTVEQFMGLPVVDESPMQSADARAFWANRNWGVDTMEHLA